MIGKGIAGAKEESQSLAWKRRSLATVVLIFFLNLVGFWLVLPGLLFTLAFILDDLLVWKSLSIAPAFVRWLTGCALAASGLVLSLYSILLFAYFGDGFPIASLRPRTLVEKGPYGLIRHPIYAGYTVSLVGIGLLFGSPSFLLFVLPAFVLCWIAYVALHEERVLMERFGEEYARYKQSTPLLLPLRPRGVGDRKVGHPVGFMVTSVAFKAVNSAFFDVEVTGNPAPPKHSPIIVVSNHASYLDPFFINAYLRDYVRCSATEASYRNPITRTYLHSAGAYPLARYKPRELQAMRESFRILRTNTSLALFPEGERSWDGEPMHISDTVVRFLQATGLPILTVNISGNYNVFPRWARRPRRGKVHLHFHPLVCLSKGKSVEENKKILAEKLHSPGSSYDPNGEVQGKRLAEGLPLLLWRCPLCKTNDCLCVEGENFVVCSSCGCKWELKPNYHLKLLSSPPQTEAQKTRPLSDWYGRIKDLETLVPLALSHGFIRKGEKAFLESKPLKYSRYRGLKKVFSCKGRVVLTDERLIFFQDKNLLSHELNEVRKVVIEANNRLEFACDDGVVSLKFRNESPLKWQTYIDKVKAVGNTPT